MALRIALFLAILSPSIANSAGFAYNANFVVYSPNQGTKIEQDKYANDVLRQAEAIRQDFAAKWLGEKMADGVGRSVIYIDFSTTEDSGLTWAKDHPGRIFHNVYLTTTPERATGSTLHHEIAHTVLATRFPTPNRLPPWCEEGIATRYDDAGRKDARRQTELHWLRTGQAPRLANLFCLESMDAFDNASYAASASLVSYLLTRSDEPTLLRFAVEAQAAGLDSALQSNYGIQSTNQLQTEWEAWLASDSG